MDRHHQLLHEPLRWWVGSYTTYNASVNWKATSDIDLSFVVTNLFNRMPDMDANKPTAARTVPRTTGTCSTSTVVATTSRPRWNFGKKD